MKILVVDDERTIREIATAFLTAAGYDVLNASSGRKALILALERKPDLILLDLIMPKMNGFQFVLEIRKDPGLSKTPILVMSALVSGSDTDDYIHELDVAGFIDKDQMTTFLIFRVQEILSKQPNLAA